MTPVALWQRLPYEGARDSIGQVFSLEEDPEERAFLEAGEVLEQRYSDPDLPASTRKSFDKYRDLAYLNMPLTFSDAPWACSSWWRGRGNATGHRTRCVLATALAEQAAVAIENARLYKRVQEQAMTDGLTGLYNHRHFHERLEQEIARARRYGTPSRCS